MFRCSRDKGQADKVERIGKRIDRLVEIDVVV